MNLRILICSDTHGKVPPAPGSDVDAILHAGDLYNCLSYERHLFDDNDIPGLRSWINGWQKPAYIVRGNHDCGDPASVIRGGMLRDVSGRVDRLGENLYVAGIGWNGRSYYDLPGEGELSVVCRDLLDDVVAKKLTPNTHYLLIAHYPFLAPGLMKKNENTRCESFDCVREVIDVLRPLAVVQGHHHSFFGRETTLSLPMRKVRMIFPGATGGLLDVDTERGVTNYQALDMQ